MRAAPVLAIVAALAIAGGGYAYWRQQAARLPAGLASANGRIEVERVDIATKLPGRVAEIRVKEGDLVARDAVVAQLDTAETLAQLAASRAAVERAVATIARTEADVAIREADHNLAEIEMLEGPARIIGLSFPSLWFQHVSLGAFAKARGVAAFELDLIMLSAFGVLYLVAASFVLKKQEK